MITYGPEDDGRGPRPIWRQLWQAEGVAVHDVVALRRTMMERSLDPEDLDRPIDDGCWPMAYATTWCPEARAHGLLRQLGVGSTLRGQGRIGRIEFHEGTIIRAAAMSGLRSPMISRLAFFRLGS